MRHEGEWRHGEVSWIDYAAEDVAAVADWYARVFGWELHDRELYPGWRHVEAALDGRLVCGISTAGGERPGWRARFEVADVDAVVSSAAAQGWRIVVPPVDMPTGVRMAVIADEWGTSSYLQTHRTASGMRLVFEPSTFAWVEMQHDEGGRSAARLARLLDLDVRRMPEGTSRRDYAFARDAGRGVFGVEIGRGPRVEWVHYFAVDDLAARIGRISSLGGVVEGPPALLGARTGSAAIVRDPRGARFGLVEFDRAIDIPDARGAGPFDASTFDARLASEATADAEAAG